MEIRLADAIRALRRELITAMADSDKQPVRFRLDTVDLELQMEATSSTEVGGGIRFWVIDASGKTSGSSASAHTIKLHMDAAMADGGEVWTSDQLEGLPE